MGARRARFAIDLGFRALGTRGDSEYLFSNPANAAQLNRAIEDSFTGRTHAFTLEALRSRGSLIRGDPGEQ